MSGIWAIISDLHGNLDALERVLVDARERSAEHIACLGDLLGGPGDEACCRILMHEADLVVFGNRELRVRLALPEDVVEWVRALPLTAVLDGFLLVHSSPLTAFPWDITDREALALRRAHGYFEMFPYISGRRSAVRAAEVLADEGLRGVFFGHTHRQVMWRVTDELVAMTERQAILMDGTYLFGVGSVGEGPDGRIDYCLYEPERQRVTLVTLDD